MQTTKELIHLLDLKQQSETVFQGTSSFMGSPNVFGGQVVAQALNAATRTVPVERICHSLHAYFILPGNLSLPIEFQVQKIRDGGSFTTRFIIAKQNDVPIFVMAASFQKREEGYEHQIQMPDVPAPETLAHWIDIDAEKYPDMANLMNAYLSIDRPLEMRSCRPRISSHEAMIPHNQVWFRFKELPETLDWPTIQQLIAYASDYNILTTALRPHSEKANIVNTQVASLDHAIWFHNETDLNDWLLFDITSPVAAHARGLATGNIFTRSGKLVVSVSQEGLMRPRI
jgi:acyl-CoA thioesterase-2